MFPKVVRYAVALSSTAVIIPYAIAFITELLYGRSSKTHNRYLRSLHPRRVFSLNLALLSNLSQIRYLRLFLKWTKHYKAISSERAIKDIQYGQNKNFLDIYRPISGEDTGLKKIIVFIYGGTWGSGDKSMYSLLCSNLADNFNSLVVCPNYSIYPKGFIDDMVQDISDVLEWLQANAILHDGDKSQIILLGHSSGAQLAALTVLELCHKYLNSFPSYVSVKSVELKDGDKLPLQVSFLEESTFVIDDKVLETEKSKSSIVVEPAIEKEDLVNGGKTEESTQVGVLNDGENLEVDVTEGNSFVVIQGTNSDDQYLNKDDEVSLEYGGVEEAVGSSLISENMEMASVTAERNDEDNLLSSIKLVIGLAGVYDIKKHYEYETTRAIENYSTMSKAMYDDVEQFDNFSPTVILKNLSSQARLPAFYLLHGSSDETVPSGSSLSFAKALGTRNSENVHLSILVDCNHIDICLDLMDRERRWYKIVMSEIGKALHKLLL